MATKWQRAYPVTGICLWLRTPNKSRLKSAGPPRPRRTEADPRVRRVPPLVTLSRRRGEDRRRRCLSEKAAELAMRRLSLNDESGLSAEGQPRCRPRRGGRRAVRSSGYHPKFLDRGIDAAERLIMDRQPGKGANYPPAMRGCPRGGFKFPEIFLKIFWGYISTAIVLSKVVALASALHETRTRRPW